MSGYNGWRNYETWSVNLIVDNDEATYHHRKALARQALREKPDEPVKALASLVQDWIEAEMPELQGTTLGGQFSHLWSQLLTAALGEVDWHELADNWLDEEKAEEGGEAEHEASS